MAIRDLGVTGVNGADKKWKRGEEEKMKLILL